jgi:hypothetical protein
LPLEDSTKETKLEKQCMNLDAFYNREKRPLVSLYQSVRPSVRSTGYISAVPTCRISVKFDNMIFYGILSRNYRFV